MNTIAKWEVTTVINRAVRRNRRKISRALYLRMLRETQQYTLLQRVASELYRAGVTPQQFLRELHKDDWSLSTRVMEEMERIDRGRNGYDPDKVPALLPIYLKPLPEDSEDTVKFKGRPTRKKAADAAMAWVKQRLLSGWSEGDIQRAIEDVLFEGESDVVVVKADEELKAEEKPRAHTKLKYYVHDGMDWQIFASPKKAKEALEQLKHRVLDNIRAAEPMLDIKARICCICKQPLNGHVYTIRSEKTKKDRTYKVVEHMHVNCFWLKRAEPCRIPLNMELLSPELGKTFVWVGADKGGWKAKDELKKATTPEAGVTPSNSPAGVPGPSSEKPPTPVPVTPPAGGSVSDVRPA